MPHKMPLLLLPGLLCDERLWQPQIKSLKDIAECRVADLTQHDDVAALAHDALSKAPDKFALAGLSMGGYVALEIMRQAPGRVTRLCLLDTSARADTSEQKKRRQLLVTMSRAGKFKGVTPRLLPLLIHAERLHDETLTSIIFAMAEKVGRDAFQRQQKAIMNRIDSRPFLKTISCPTHIICGREDALTPPDIMQELADGIPAAHMDVVEACGHLSPLEQPDAVNAMMRTWLTV